MELNKIYTTRDDNGKPLTYFFFRDVASYILKFEYNTKSIADRNLNTLKRINNVHSNGIIG